jgi:ArsR family transcriptional regulator
MLTPEQFFRALSDTTRLNSLLLMEQEGRLCVCELVQALDLSQPRISRHLGQLRDQGIVQDERQGQWVHYRLSEDLPDWARETLRAVLASRDLGGLTERLTAMPKRPSLVANQSLQHNEGV